MSAKPSLSNIAFVLDERLSREKAALLSRIVHACRRFAKVEMIPGSVTEDELLKRLSNGHFQLVLAPWYRYLSWSRIEALYGLTRTSGPTFAGYFCDQVLPYELGDQADHLRAILLDFATLTPQEAALLTRSLAIDSYRSGIRPLLEPGTPIYCENWYLGHGLGARMDQVIALPEIGKSDWVKRSNAIRIALGSLWSLVYEEGPGKSEFAQNITASSPKAYFQVGADKTSLVMRLCYAMPTWSPKDAVAKFWPNPKQPSSPAQLLLKFADFARVHLVAETNDVEVVAGFLVSAPSESSPNEVHTIWVEPIAPQLVTEVPFEAPGPANPNLKALPSPRPQAPLASIPAGTDEGQKLEGKDRFIFEAAMKIRELKKLIGERDQLITELKRGGVGTNKPLPPPDIEALLDAFQEKYFQARYEIRQFELQIAGLEEKGASPQQVEKLRLQMAALTEREKVWIRKIAATLEAYREVRRKSQS